MLLASSAAQGTCDNEGIAKRARQRPLGAPLLQGRGEHTPDACFLIRPGRRRGSRRALLLGQGARGGGYGAAR